MNQNSSHSEQKAEGTGIAQANGDGASANVNVFKPGRGCKLEFGHIMKVSIFFVTILAFLLAITDELHSISIFPPPPTAEQMVDTPTPLASMLMAVTTADIPCYAENNDYTITISPFVVVEILEKNSIGNWVKVRVNDVVVCWVELSSLKFDNNNLASVQTVDVPIPQISTPTIFPIPTHLPVDGTTTPPPLLIRWKILSYDCTNGRATGATISLDVTGGIPDYSYFPKLPIYAKPDQFLSISVYSGTSNGQPNGLITFTVPSATNESEFRCDQPADGNVPLPPPPPTDLPPPTDPLLTEDSGNPPPTCYNPQGKVIPCH